MSKIIPLYQQYLNLIKSGKSFDKIIQKVNIISAKDGICKAEFTVEQEQTNPFGFLHGSYSASLVDMISGIALLTHEREAAGVSVNMNISYLKGASIGDQLEVIAKTIKAGKNLGFLEVEIRNKETGDLLVTGSHTKYIGDM